MSKIETTDDARKSISGDKKRVREYIEKYRRSAEKDKGNKKMNKKLAKLLNISKSRIVS